MRTDVCPAGSGTARAPRAVFRAFAEDPTGVRKAVSILELVCAKRWTRGRVPQHPGAGVLPGTGGRSSPPSPLAPRP
jgi:hypothetical protein